MKFFLTILIICTSVFRGFSQSDSLYDVFTNSSSKEEKFNAALELSDQMLYVDVEAAKNYIAEAKKLANELKDPVYFANVSLYEFEVLNVQDLDNEAVDLMLETISLCKSNDLISDLGHAYNKLGSVYIKTQLFDKAKEYFVLANEKFKESGDLESQRNTLNNLGAIYYYNGDINGAIEYFKKSYDIEVVIDNKEGMAQTLGNIGAMYVKLDPPDYIAAESALLKSVDILHSIDNPKVLIASLNNLTYYYIQIGDYENAKKYNDQALVIARSNELNRSILACLENRLDILMHEGDFEYALEVALEIRELDDEIYSADNTKALAELETVYQTKEKQKENELLKKQGEIDKVKLDYEQQKSLYLFIGLGIVAALGFFAFNRFLVSQKRKKVIEIQKDKVEEQKELLHEQNEIVKEKNAEISDSITYAKRIQTAILPPTDALNYHLNDGFLIFKPKDIVSGDFYWLFAKGDDVYFAVADCTGHGVPGAMVSVVCSNALNRSTREFGLTNPAEILDKTRELVVENFSLNNHPEISSDTIKDGMDISLCVLNKKTHELKWAGANNPIWIIRVGEFQYKNIKQEVFENITLSEIQGDKQPVGIHEGKKPFTCHSLKLMKDDQIVIFSDGYADQFGGEKGKKLKYRPFKQLLLKNYFYSMEDQKNRLEKFFEVWMDGFEQIDDVCVIGVKV